MARPATRGYAREDFVAQRVPQTKGSAASFLRAGPGSSVCAPPLAGAGGTRRGHAGRRPGPPVAGSVASGDVLLRLLQPGELEFDGPQGRPQLRLWLIQLPTKGRPGGCPGTLEEVRPFRAYSRIPAAAYPTILCSSGSHSFRPNEATTARGRSVTTVGC